MAFHYVSKPSDGACHVQEFLFRGWQPIAERLCQLLELGMIGTNSSQQNERCRLGAHCGSPAIGTGTLSDYVKP